MSTESVYLLATEAALALTVRHLAPPHTLGDVRVFTAGRLATWSGWQHLSEPDARAIARYLKLRPEGLAQDAHLLRWARAAFDRAVRFRAAHGSESGFGDPFERIAGKPIDQLVDELLGALEARRRPRELREPSAAAAGVVRLRGRRYHFTIPADDLPTGSAEWPRLAESSNRSPVTLLRRDLLDVADRLDASGVDSVSYRNVLERDLLSQINVGESNVPFGDGIEIPPGPTRLVVAPTGCGKSVFTRVAALALACAGRPVAIVVPDIPATLQETHRIERGASALGGRLAVATLNGHRALYSTTRDVLAHPPRHDPRGEWTLGRLGYFCRLAAYAEDASPAPGEEPCHQLREKTLKGERAVLCPFMHDCPKFDAYRDASAADILVLNHFAFVKGRMPLPVVVGDRAMPRLPIIDLVLRRADLVLIDEVDELQHKVIEQGTGLLPLSSGHQLSPLHELFNEFEERRASGELPVEERFERIRRPMLLVRWLSEELADGINRGDIKWPRSDRMRWSRAKDGWLSSRLFGDQDGGDERFDGLFGNAPIADDSTAEELRKAVRRWTDGQLDDDDETDALRSAVISILEGWPRMLNARRRDQTKARSDVADGLILRAILARLEQALNHLRVHLASLDEYGFERAAGVRDRLLGYAPWAPSPLGP